jgi:hypothetical protein
MAAETRPATTGVRSRSLSPQLNSFAIGGGGYNLGHWADNPDIPARLMTKLSDFSAGYQWRRAHGTS